MGARAWLRRGLPHSLWQQTLLLLAVAIALTALFTARPYHSYFRKQFEAQLQQRGRSTVQTLAKDYELRPAIVLKDAAQAEPILRSFAATDEELVYVAVIKGQELIAAAPSVLAGPYLAQALQPLSSQAQQHQKHEDEILRFVETVRAEKSLDFMDLPGADSPSAGPDVGYVVLGLSTRQAHSRARWQTLFSVGTTSLFVFTLLILFYFRWVARRLRRMVRFAQATAAGDGKAELSDPIADDLGRLAQALHHSTTELHKANAGLEATVAARTAELQTTLADLWSEMDLARKIQSVLLPSPQEIAGRYDYAGVMKPADEVGGDYYDTIEADGKLWVLIGDVSGHGVSAGLIMMMVQTAVRVVVQRFAAASQPLSPGQLLTLVNRALWRNLQLIGKGQYMTMTALCIDDSGVTYAGLHQHILIYRKATKEVDEVETQGCWIGILDEIEGLNEDRRFELSPGDAFLLYTDGLIEAKLRDRPDDMLNLPPVISRFQAACLAQGTAVNTAQSVLAETNQCIVTDDVAVVVLRRLV
jgi:serine phosphatase RsbU (regulator of sigma subunit)